MLSRSPTAYDDDKIYSDRLARLSRAPGGNSPFLAKPENLVFLGDPRSGSAALLGSKKLTGK